MRILPALLLCVLFACSKDVENMNIPITGKWYWTTTYGKSANNNTFTAVPDATNAMSLSFHDNGNFKNESVCLLPGPTEGNYSVKVINDYGVKQPVLILSSGLLKDTFNVKLLGETLQLTERHTRVYLHVHEFSRTPLEGRPL